MPRALWLPDILRDSGLNVVVEDGWQARGSATFNPQGMVWHHTAGPASGNFPTLPVLINGRSDLPGPLCQIGGARDGTVHVIASGRANHAGRGGWRGLSGNSSVFGWEPEHPGKDYVAWGAQLESMRVGTAAIFRHLGWDPRMLCGHKEWTSRKIDPAGVDMGVERARLEVALRQGTRQQEVVVTDPEDVAYWQRILAKPTPHRPGKGNPYDIGAVDGVVGPKTEAAIKDWQARRGIKVTGTLNLTTCCSLQSHANLAYVDAKHANYA